MIDTIKITDASIPQRIQDTLTRAAGLDPVTKLNSLQNYWNKHGYLTDRQYAMFINIEERFSQQQIDKGIWWLEGYDEEKKKLFSLACLYYKHSVYFTEIWTKYVADNNYIPTWREYKNMCENKYFQRALENYNAEPAYVHGDLVTLRKKYTYKGEDPPMGMVQSISDKRSFQKAGRSYTIMWFNTQEIYDQWYEHDIKLYREKKVKEVKHV